MLKISICLIALTLAVFCGCSGPSLVQFCEEHKNTTLLQAPAKYSDKKGLLAIVLVVDGNRYFSVNHSGTVGREITDKTEIAELEAAAARKTVDPAILEIYRGSPEARYGHQGENIIDVIKKRGAPEYCSGYNSVVDRREHFFEHMTKTQEDAATECRNSAVAKFYFHPHGIIPFALYADSNGTVVREQIHEYPNTFKSHWSRWWGNFWAKLLFPHGLG